MNTPTTKRRDNGHNTTEETIVPSEPPTITRLQVPDLHNHHRFRRESELSDVERTEQQEKEMAELANDLEMALTNNVLARTVRLFKNRKNIFKGTLVNFFEAINSEAIFRSICEEFMIKNMQTKTPLHINLV